MHGMRQGFQAQAPLDGAQETAQRGETLPVPQVSQTVLPQRLLQPTHQPQVLLLQARPRPRPQPRPRPIRPQDRRTVIMHQAVASSSSTTQFYAKSLQSREKGDVIYFKNLKTMHI